MKVYKDFDGSRWKKWMKVYNDLDESRQNIRLH